MSAIYKLLVKLVTRHLRVWWIKYVIFKSLQARCHKGGGPDTSSLRIITRRYNSANQSPQINDNNFKKKRLYEAKNTRLIALVSLSHGVKTEWSGVLQEAYRSDENENAKMARLGIDDGLEDQYEDRKWGLYKMASEAYTQELATPYGCTARETIIERQRLRVREETQSEDDELADKSLSADNIESADHSLSADNIESADYGLSADNIESADHGVSADWNMSADHTLSAIVDKRPEYSKSKYNSSEDIDDDQLSECEGRVIVLMD
jgi:hypothetical protein